MSILVIGGTGFIGRRLIALLAQQGEEIVCLDLNPSAASFERFGSQVRMIRGDVSQFDDVMAATSAAKPSRVVHLAYLLGSDNPPHHAFKINIAGVDNCFEAARLCDVGRVVFGSSLAVNGEQRLFGDHPVNEDDLRLGTYQYAMHKIFNEMQAQDYREKYGMEITAVRPANVTGADKVVGSVDHVQCITFPAQGKPISFPYSDTMRCPIHVDDIAEVFARITMKDKPEHATYNSGGTTVSMGELADIVREFVPAAQISFENDSGGKEHCTNYLIDNSRLIEEFGVQYPPFRERILQIINDVRQNAGLPLVTAPAGMR
jgi:nucleoside-diphosphate-sugar epimerase